MKKLTTLFIASLFIIGCENRRPITAKKYIGNGICEYEYHNGGFWVKTKDSCNKYSVGDTITFKK